MRKILIPYKYVPEYRRPFFSRLRERALPEFDVRVSAGNALGEQIKKSDEVFEDWYLHHENALVPFSRKRLIWQKGVLRQAAQADRIIVEQANALLVNQILLASSRSSTAFWGHGFDHQASDRRSLNERLKKKQLLAPSWWFAYTKGTAKYLEDSGVKSDRITVVQNSIDTNGYAQACASVPPSARPPAALYLGSLYREKRLGFLIESADVAHEINPRFCLTIAGDGPDRRFVQSAASSRPWITYLGRVDSIDEKVALAQNHALIVNPGLIGLIANESFGLATPIITLDGEGHSPEFEYLIADENCEILSGTSSVEDFGRAVASLLDDRRRLDQLYHGCVSGAKKYTIEAMVDNFLGGIEEWFSQDG